MVVFGSDRQLCLQCAYDDERHDAIITILSIYLMGLVISILGLIMYMLEQMSAQVLGLYFLSSLAILVIGLANHMYYCHGDPPRLFTIFRIPDSPVTPPESPLVEESRPQ
jgi:hypothetical protein